MGAIKQFKHLQQSDDALIANIQLLLADKGISEAELSRQTGIPQPTLHKILTGKTSDPRISTLKSIAEYFEVSLDNLYSGNIFQALTPVKTGHSVPIINWEMCSDLSKLAKLSPTNWDEWTVIDHINHTNVYALKSRPSMEPRFPRGTLLIIDPKAHPSDGDLVVTCYPNTTEATLRELLIDGPSKQLLPLKGGATSWEFADDIKIIGTVIQSRFTFQG